MNTPLTIILFCIGLLSGELRAAELRIRAAATVEENVVRLSDVARVSDVDPKIEAKLKDIVLGPAPPAGSTARIDFAALRSRLRASGVDLSRMRFSGRNNVLVTRVKTRSSVRPAVYQAASRRQPPSEMRERAEEVLSQAIHHYLKRVATNLGKVEVTVEVNPRDTATVLSARGGGFEFTGFQPPLYRPQTLRATFRDAGGKERAIRFGCHISHQPYVFSAKYRIPRGGVIQRADLALRQVESPEDAFMRAENIVGMEVTRAISAGTVIKRTDVRRKPLIRRNQIVKVISRRPGIQIQRQMKSRDEGALGEMVTLFDPKSRRTIIAEVIGPSQAEVKAGNPHADRGGNSNRIIFRRPGQAASGFPSSDENRLRRVTKQRYDKDRVQVRQTRWRSIGP